MPNIIRDNLKLIIGAFVSLLIVLYFTGSSNSENDAGPLFKLGKVTKGSITDSISSSGKIEALVTVDVGSQLSGQIMKLHVDFNSEVTAGQPLAELDPATFEARQQQAVADLSVRKSELKVQLASIKRAEADLMIAKNEMDRGIALHAKGHVSNQQLDTLKAGHSRAVASLDITKSQYSMAQSRVEQSQASLNSANVDLSRTVIRSPIDGVVVGRQIDLGQTVASSFQSPTLFTIAQDLRKMQLQISVDEADIGKVQPNQVVRFTVDTYPEDEFEGTITQVRKQPVELQNVVTYTVIASADNSFLRLLPGMTADVTIVIIERKDVLRVPTSSLRFNPEGAARMTADNSGGNARLQGGGGRNGAGAMERYKTELNLSEAEVSSLDAAFDAMRQKMRAAFTSGRGGEDRATVRRKIMQDLFRSLQGNIAPEKLEKLREMMGQGRERRNAGNRTTRGRVWVLDAEGNPQEVLVRVGLTDGTFSEIVGTSDLNELDDIITGLNTSGAARTRGRRGFSIF
jgi:HlyD family secretion protein